MKGKEELQLLQLSEASDIITSKHSMQQSILWISQKQEKEIFSQLCNINWGNRKPSLTLLCTGKITQNNNETWTVDNVLPRKRRFTIQVAIRYKKAVSFGSHTYFCLRIVLWDHHDLLRCSGFQKLSLFRTHFLQKAFGQWNYFFLDKDNLNGTEKFQTTYWGKLSPLSGSRLSWSSYSYSTLNL